MKQPTPTVARPRRLNWLNVSTVVSAAILIGAEVFGAAFAGGWAIGVLFDLGDYGAYIAQALLFVAGVFMMVAFLRGAIRAEPFFTHD